MTTQIGEMHYETLLNFRAIIREALARHKSDEFERYVLRRDNKTALVYSCSRKTCFECGERIEDGLALTIFENPQEKV